MIPPGEGFCVLKSYTSPLLTEMNLFYVLRFNECDIMYTYCSVCIFIYIYIYMLALQSFPHMEEFFEIMFSYRNLSPSLPLNVCVRIYNTYRGLHLSYISY